MGVQGIDTCVGVIARTINGPQSQMFAVHFGSTENPFPTLNSHSYMFNANSRVIVVFSKNVDRALLESVLEKLRRDFNVDPEIFRHSELFMDQNMQLYIRQAIP